jgi:hypothetical protein
MTGKTPSKPLLYGASLLILLNVAMFALPFVGAPVSYHIVSAGKSFRITAAQGYSAFGGDFYFVGYSRDGTGDINDFNTVKMGVAGDVWPRFGFCSDTPTSTVTLTDLTDSSLTYTTSAAGNQRLWTPDLGTPDSISGGLMSWDGTNSVVNVATLGAATVTLSWSTPAAVTHTGLMSGVDIIATIFPAVAVVLVIGGLRDPENGDTLIKLAIMAGLVALIAAMI